MDKEQTFNFINDNKKKFYNIKNIQIKNNKLKQFILENNLNINIQLNDNYYDNMKNILINLKNYNNDDIKCLNNKCVNETEYIGWCQHNKNHNRFGFKLFCCIECKNTWWSNKQITSNTSLRMTEESRKISYDKLSKNVKNRIKNGTWTPNITNSWAGSKVQLNINNNVLYYRSSWDAFFHLCNQNLNYEYTRIQYQYKNNWHNYITDFTDIYNKIIYEIKPEGNLVIGKNKAKFKYAEQWCLENDYKFIIITNDWFKQNYTNNIKLLDNQEDKDIIIKRLKRQFENEN